MRKKWMERRGIDGADQEVPCFLMRWPEFHPNQLNRLAFSFFFCFFLTSPNFLQLFNSL